MSGFHDTADIPFQIQGCRIDRIIVRPYPKVDRACKKVVRTIGNIELGLRGRIAIYLIEHPIHLMLGIYIGLFYDIGRLDGMFVGEVLGILE